MAYIVESDVLEESELSSEAFEGGDDAYWKIKYTGSGILLMVLQTRYPLWWMEKRVPGRKGSCIGSVLLWISLQVSPLLKWRYLGEFLIGNRDFPRWKSGG